MAVRVINHSPSRGAAAKAALKCYLSAAPIQPGDQRGAVSPPISSYTAHNCHVNTCRCYSENNPPDPVHEVARVFADGQPAARSLPFCLFKAIFPDAAAPLKGF